MGWFRRCIVQWTRPYDASPESSNPYHLLNRTDIQKPSLIQKQKLKEIKAQEAQPLVASNMCKSRGEHRHTKRDAVNECLHKLLH